MGDVVSVECENWDGTVVSHPVVVVQAQTVADVASVITDSARYPSPVRPVGGNLSPTPCGAADGGTVIDLSSMNRILEMGPDRVTAEAGCRYVDVARELARHGLQFYVNLEMGNLTIGSAATSGTKDSAMPGEFGHVSSYAIGMKVVTPGGEVLEVSEDQQDLLKTMRSSYGLLGVVCEATFKVRPLRAMRVRHAAYKTADFSRRLPDLARAGESMMLYLFPYLGQVLVEFRSYQPGAPRTHRVWRLRNLVWRQTPRIRHAISRLPGRQARSVLLNTADRVTAATMTKMLAASATSPPDQIIEHVPAPPGPHRYLFSIWAFPQQDYGEILRQYQDFCRDYYARTGYRTDMPNVGYRIPRDDSSLFSYGFAGDALTIDPVFTGTRPGWEEFLREYNNFAAKNRGIPLFNQTRYITAGQVQQAFGDRVQVFKTQRRLRDPANRLLNAYFADVLDEH